MPERPLVSFGGAVLALGLPPIFLHVIYQPGVTVTLGSTPAHLYLSDIAVLLIGVAAAVAGVRGSFAPLRAALPIWIVSAAFLVLLFAACFYPLFRSGSYAWRDHAVTAAKFAEYAILALAVPLLIRRRAELALPVLALAAWSVAATLVGVIQFFGGSIAGGWPAGRRQPSFLGHHDFAALSGGALALGVAALAFPAWRVNKPLAVVAGTSGLLGLVLSGSTAGAIGFVAGIGGATLVAWRRRGLSLRRGALLGIVAAVSLAGVVALRSGDFDQFFRFVGARQAERSTGANVQTYVQHSLLAYIGLRIWLDHPVLGAGWQASEKEPAVYSRYLADAHRRFPHAAELSFPSPQHEYGVQNGYVQALADLGIVGLLLFVGWLAIPIVLAARTAVRGPPAVAGPALAAGIWLVGIAGIWSALGLVAGIPLDAAAWLAIGIVALISAGALHEPA